MTKLEHALAHARRGFSVFPLRSYDPNSMDPDGPAKAAKKPAIKHWQDRATTDEAQIRKWWTATPDANIGHPTFAEIVVDVDTWKGGKATFTALGLVDPFPGTTITKSQSGGAHLFYALPPHVIVRGAADMLGPGVDVKSWGGYVVMPGSTIEGRAYELADARPIEPAPQWLVDRCKEGKARSATAGKRLLDETPGGVALAKQWLVDNAPEAKVGRRGFTAFHVACEFYEYAVSKDTCIELLCEWSNLRCEVPMDEADILHAADSANKNMQNPKGLKNPDYAGGFKAVTIEERATQAAIRLTGEKPKGLYFLTFKDAANRALTHGAEPLVEGLLDCETMSVVYGESNSGKSFTEMDKDFRISIGEPVAGRAVKQGAVVWIAAEGGSGVYKRLAALKLHYKRDDAPFFIVPCPVDLRRADADVKPLIALIKQIEAESGLKVVKVTIDTLSRVMAGGDENSPVDMGLLVHHFDAIRYVTKAHVAIIHHTGKDKAKGARGHSLLRAATDTEIEVGSRTITVTKQRDLEGDIKMHFGLVVVRIGTDMRGKEVTSCYVAIGAKGSVQFDVPATTAERELMQDIERALLTAECSEFGWEFVVDNCPKRRKTDSDKDSDKKRARSTVVEHLSGLSDKGYLEKLFDNQYVTGCRSLSESTKT